MIKTEIFTIDNRSFTRTYSDRGMKIHGGFPEGDYDVAEDPTEFNRVYIETDIPIESDDDSEAPSQNAEELLGVLLGGE